MAEQITHKKSLKRLDHEKRNLLKEYYKLNKESTPVSVGESKTDANSEVNAVASIENPEKRLRNEEDELKAELEKGQIDAKTKTLKRLLHVQNILLEEETEADNMIKNTIYDNYYDLIKVDDLLKEMSHCDGSMIEQLRQTCKIAESLLEQR